jgi:hypothetical protein
MPIDAKPCHECLKTEWLGGRSFEQTTSRGSMDFIAHVSLISLTNAILIIRKQSIESTQSGGDILSTSFVRVIISAASGKTQGRVDVGESATWIQAFRRHATEYALSRKWCK